MSLIRQKFSDLYKVFDVRISTVANRLNRTFLLFAVIILPLAIAVILPLIFWGKSVLSFFPNSSDEITYWREISTFVNFGFGGGQYSNDELPARFAGSHFGTHGPAFAVLYGIVGKFFGWHEYSPVLINLFLVGFAIFIAIRVTRPGNKQLLILLLLFGTWWPLQLYIPSNMQEILHSSAAIVLAALFYKFFMEKNSKVRYSIYISLLLVFLVPFRFIWAFLLFPLVLFFPTRVTLKSWIWASIGASVLLLAGAWFVFTFYSPSPWFWTTLFQTFQISISAGITEFLQHFSDSLQKFLRLNEGLSLVILVRYQALGLLLAWAIQQIKDGKRDADSFSNDVKAGVFNLFNLGSVLIFVLLFYDILDTRDYRMFIAPLLLSLLLLVFSNKLSFVYPVIALNFVFLFFFLSHYPPYRFFNFNHDPLLLQETAESINSHIEFEPAKNRWCNTISISKYGGFNAFSYPLTVVHSGFGTTTILDWKEFRDRPLQAKYVLLDPDYSVPNFGSPVNHYDLIEMVSTPLGTLFLNPLSPCGD